MLSAPRAATVLVPGAGPAQDDPQADAERAKRSHHARCAALYTGRPRSGGSRTAGTTAAGAQRPRGPRRNGLRSATAARRQSAARPRPTPGGSKCSSSSSSTGRSRRIGPSTNA
eukprot:8796894-Alexandrium_andersonii.AAC.1